MSFFTGFLWSSPITCPSSCRAGRVEGFLFVAPPQAALGYRTNSRFCWMPSFCSLAKTGKQKLWICLRTKSPSLESLAVKITHAKLKCPRPLLTARNICCKGYFVVLTFDLSFHFVCGPCGGFPFRCTSAECLRIRSK